MKHLELFANRSVENEIIEALEKKLEISIMPYCRKHATETKQDTGTYRQGRKPEFPSGWEHMHGRKYFLLISYLDQEDAVKAEAVIKEVKQRFPCEKIKLLIIEAHYFP